MRGRESSRNTIPFTAATPPRSIWVRRAGADSVAVVMSGSFVQRGEPALFSKFLRARAALACGGGISSPSCRCPGPPPRPTALPRAGCSCSRRRGATRSALGRSATTCRSSRRWPRCSRTPPSTKPSPTGTGRGGRAASRRCAHSWPKERLPGAAAPAAGRSNNALGVAYLAGDPPAGACRSRARSRSGRVGAAHDAPLGSGRDRERRRAARALLRKGGRGDGPLSAPRAVCRSVSPPSARGRGVGQGAVFHLAA